MYIPKKKLNVLYCSQFISYRIHRELVRIAGESNCRIISIPWNETALGTYISPIPFDGVISHLTPDNTGLLTKTTNQLPHVTMNAETADKLKLPGAVADHFLAGQMVADHFLSLGFTNFAAFVDSERYHTFRRRVDGYTHTIVEAGLPQPETVSLTEEAGRDRQRVLLEFQKALRNIPAPLAIMAANDRAAVKVMEACLLCDLTIPFQVAVCGFDNDPVTCDIALVPLSSVDINPELQAQETFRILLEMLQGKKPPVKPVIIKPKGLVVRRSSGLQAHADSTVAKALAFIHEQTWNQNLQIPLIAAHAGVSRSTLFHLFNKTLSTTPLEYITKLRVDKAREMMRTTGQKTSEVRPLCGFATDYQMYRAFKRTTGKSPGSFKKHLP